MTPEYLRLAAHRAATQWPPYLHPENFGYDFREWVSPYTKGAHATGGVALVLQDWASAERLAGGPEPEIQHFGRIRDLPTNRRLEQLLLQVLGLRIDQVYITNAFPFINLAGCRAVCHCATS